MIEIDEIIVKKIVVGVLCLCFLTSIPIGFGKNTLVAQNKPVQSMVNDILDLVVANAHVNSISFFPGNGLGEFGVRHDSAAGLAPTGIIAEDFNKDGNLDVAVTDNNGSSIAVLLGNGLGLFSAPSYYLVGGLSNGITAGDFNQDGNLDLAISNQNDSTISILYGNGTGGFGMRHDYLVGTGPAGIVTFDFDNDGYLDIAVADSYEGTVGVLLGNGTTGFASCLFYPCGIDHTSKPEGLVLGDFNNDTIMDLVVTNHNGNSVAFLSGDGTGGFGNSNFYDLGAGSAPFGIVAGDFNEDEKLDVAVTNQLANTVSVLFGDGTGNFMSRKDFPVSVSPVGIIAARFTADDDLDFAITNHNSACVTVLFGDGTGSFKNILNLTVGNGPSGLVAGRFRSDTTIPVVKIIKPVNGLYLMNMKILPFFKPLIIGSIEIQVNATDNSSGINRVEFYIDAKLMNQTSIEPYHWTWTKLAFFKHTITVKAYDNAENVGQAEIIVSRFF